MKLSLPKITLVTINTIDPELSIKALEYSSNKIKFNKNILITANCQIKTKNIEIINIDPLDIKGYSHFILRKLHEYITTDFCLVIQSDGFVINPNLWSNEFLNYDYIGAPWPDDADWIARQSMNFQEKYIQNLKNGIGRVGNGGFSLRSKNLLALTAMAPFHENMHPEDNYFAIHYLDYFRGKGIKFAPVEVAARFSLENPIKEVAYNFKNSFGFHGKLNRSQLQYINELTQPDLNIFQKIKHYFVKH
jgi:hypothetical protein